MHEMSLAMSIVEIAVDHAKAAGASRIRSVRVEIGALSHVEPRALTFGFDVASRDTAAEGAALVIDHVPGTATCLSCVRSFTLDNRYDACPICSGHRYVITSGEEMRVKDLEVI